MKTEDKLKEEIGKMITEEKLKKEIESCKECCYVRDMTNIKPALCNYHQGYQEGLKEATSGKYCVKLVEQGKQEVYKEVVDKLIWIYNKSNHINFSESIYNFIEELKQKLKEQKK